ncbi:hypothetical protein DU002_06835 [Corallincola holothuriorum]|uniref:Uncharacterized protein n=1 Tax=Corallincola holothuriorum TaxID=2282215 RepID=A0A368NLP2_9GAMM|nr:hypothetical protein [Corallincola holothuriorum]RCU51030.1 hypothetical protein DU002_06835 [Corallincola holothuriorum]
MGQELQTQQNYGRGNDHIDGNRSVVARSFQHRSGGQRAHLTTLDLKLVDEHGSFESVLSLIDAVCKHKL